MAKNYRNIQRQRDSKNAGFYYKRKFRWLDGCVYCGQQNQCLDHVFPLSLAAQINLSYLSVRKALKFCLYLVPCCNSCNQIASNKPFNSVLEKRKYIQRKLYEKNKEKIKTVIWDKEEIEQLGRNMRAEVLKMLNNRYVLEKRIFYPKPSNSISLDVIEMFRKL